MRSAGRWASPKSITDRNRDQSQVAPCSRKRGAILRGREATTRVGEVCAGDGCVGRRHQGGCTGEAVGPMAQAGRAVKESGRQGAHESGGLTVFREGEG